VSGLSWVQQLINTHFSRSVSEISLWLSIFLMLFTLNNPQDLGPEYLEASFPVKWILPRERRWFLFNYVIGSLYCSYWSRSVLLARDVIYTSRAYLMMPVSICLWRLCIVVTGCDGSWIDIACLDRWMSLLLTDSAWLGSSDGMMPGFLVEEGGMEKV